MPIGPLPVLARSGSRRSLRAALIGGALAVSAGMSAAPALAAPTAGADVRSAVPDFTVSGTLHVQLAAAPAPADLDLSGARFTVLDGAGAVAGSCDTDGAGTCAIPVAGDAPAPALYRLVQDAGHPVPGLVPSSAVTTFAVCVPAAVGAVDAPACPDSAVRTVTDASSFRTGLAVTVEDGATQLPLAGAEYSLTGPDYRHRPAVPQEAETTVFPDPALSGADGRLTFPGWFLPGAWSLTPEVTPRGYRSSGVLPVTVPAPTAGAGDVWSTAVGLAADVPEVIGTGRPPVPPVAPPAPPAGPAPRPAVAPPVAALPVAAAPVAVSPAPAPATAPTAVPASEASSPPAASPVPDAPGVPVPPAAAAPVAGPQLRVSSAMSLTNVGLIGFAAVLVALAAFGIGYVRRRARR